MVKVFTRIGGKLLEPISYQLQKILIFNSVPTDTIRIPITERILTMLNKLLVLDNLYTTNKLQKNTIY
jgi:hypothetical protein